MSPAPLILIVLLAFSGSAYAQCQCIDVGDIKARSKEAKAAIEAYGQEMGKMAEQTQRTHDPLLYTDARRAKLQGNIQKALNGVNAGRISPTPTIEGGAVASAGNLCNIVYKLHPSATACMRESIKRHEEYHQKQCQGMLSASGIAVAAATGKGTDRFERTGATLIQYASEEIGGYLEEVKFLNSEEARLAQACKPKAPVVRDYTSEQRNRSPAGQKPADPVRSGVDEVRRRLGF